MIERDFEAQFGRPPDQTAFAPGRVNLIGEHIDYNGGTVLPAALPLGVTVALAARSDDAIRVASDAFDAVEESRLGDGKRGVWSDHVAGAVQQAVEAGWLRGGADVLVHSNLPHGAGVSSSAALIVAVLKVCSALAGQVIAPDDVARRARRVENDFIGVPCGIMDQMAVAACPPGQALALDTRTLAHETIPLLPGHTFAVIHSGQERRLSDGRYAIRTEECDAAKAALGTGDLCHVSPDAVTAAGLADPIAARVRHCISEHRRVEAAIEALKTADAAKLGELMNASHVSMRDDFDVSTPEIDALVETAREAGAIGARLTGGGFGGCIVALVETGHVEAWRNDTLSHHASAWWVCGLGG